MKTILVTGSSDGIGLETARQLKAKGHRVILHGRNQARLDKARRELGIEEGLIADFSSLDAVAAMGSKLPALDILINNAGVYLKERNLTAQGIESTLAINHFAPMLLTLRAKAALQGSSERRVVTVASGVHQGAEIDTTDFSMARGFSGYGAYAASKVANVYFAARLTREPGFERVLSFSLHPGVIATKLLRVGFGSGGSSLESGAKTSVYCALEPGLEKQNGNYFSNSSVASSAAVRDTKMQDALWDASLKVLSAWLN